MAYPRFEASELCEYLSQEIVTNSWISGGKITVNRRLIRIERLSYGIVT